MAFWLASRREGQASDYIQRFDPRFWTVNFPRPMVAAVTSTAPDALRVDAAFVRKCDLGGLIWDSADTFDHPLLAYASDRDYRRTSLSFHWRSAGIVALDAANGPTLTIEGMDESGSARTWYVRLWNYAQGTGEDAEVRIDFSQLDGGFVLPADADPVWPAAIDRLFISFAPPGFDAASEDPLEAPLDAWFEMSEIRAQGARAMLEIGDIMLPAHGLALATGFDDEGVQTPARLLRNIRQLGYRGSVVHYVGMSHYFRLASSNGTYLAGMQDNPLNAPTQRWHASFFAECVRLGFSPVASLSYEMLAQHCPADWQQRDCDGRPALTGWTPPSTLLSPASAEAMAWLQSVGTAFAGLMVDAGAPVRFQVGEAWWWTFADGHICIYDDAARAAIGGNAADIPDMRATLDVEQKAALDWAGDQLAASTAALVDAVRAAAAPGPVEALALIFTPTVLNPAMPELKRANLPLGWARPAFDRLQVEDYDWLTAGADGLRRDAMAEVDARLGYPPEDQDFFAGFVLDAADRDQWRQIDAAIDAAAARAPHEVVVWALPQIVRDGYVRLPPSTGDDDMQAFDDVLYPIALGRDATIIPEFSTSISVTASGFERRNSLWANARLRFDVGPGVRSDAELGQLIAFFRARRGAARGFRLRDPSDYSSHNMTGIPAATDQDLGTGDGLTTDFRLVKRYGVGEAVQARRITRPEPGSVLISIDGVVQTGTWSLEHGGVVRFEAAPPAGAHIRAGFIFDVPVRFADDQLEISGAAFAAGEAPSVAIVEIREAA